MESKVQHMLDEKQDPKIGLRIALRRYACTCAEKLAKSSPGHIRIAWRLHLIQALEACKQYADEPFWRDVLAEVRTVMDIKSKRGNDS